MEEHGYKFLIFMSSISIIGAVPSFYSEIYNGYTLIMPLTDGDTRIPLNLNSSFAKQWCSRIDSSLPRITDEIDQRNLVQFIRNATRKYQSVGIENIFVNNINHTLYNNWTWVNGQPNLGFTVRQVSNGAVGYLWTNDYRISESRPSEPRRYICETSTTMRNSSNCTMKIGNRCYWKKDVTLTWYKARQACSNEGGDFASFEKFGDNNLKVVLKNLSLEASKAYWVGISKSVWRWNDKDADSEIKYSNWKADRPSNYSAKCLCLNKQPNNDYEWIECECDQSYPFICKRNGTFVSSTALYRPTSKASTVDIKTRSTVGITKTSTVGITTRPTVGITARPTVGITKTSTVGITTRSTVGITTRSTVCITERSTVGITTISTVDVKTKSTLSPQPMNDVTHTSSISGSVLQILLLIACCVITFVLAILIVVACIIRKERNRLVKSSLEVPSAAKTTEVATNESAIYDEIEEIKETKANKSSTNCTASRAMYTAVRSAPKARKEKQPKDIIVYAELDILSTA